MIFNGVEKEYLKVTSELFRPPTPPIEFDQYGQKKKFIELYLPVPVRILSDDNVEFIKKDIAEWLYHKDPKMLTFKQIPDRHYLAEYEDMILFERGNYANGYIYFYMKDPYRYSNEKSLNIKSQESRVIKGHKSTFWSSRTKFTSNVTGYTLQFNEVGKKELKDINKIVLNGEFRSGDILEIDYRKRKVTLNNKDISNQLVIMQSNYAELPIGSVEFKASHDTDVFYYERYY